VETNRVEPISKVCGQERAKEIGGHSPGGNWGRGSTARRNNCQHEKWAGRKWEGAYGFVVRCLQWEERKKGKGELTLPKGKM